MTRTPISVLLISVLQSYMTIPILQTCQVSLQQTVEAFSQRTDMACTSTLGIYIIISRRQKYQISSRFFLVLYLFFCCSGVNSGCLLVPAWTVRTGDSCWVQLFPLPSNGRHRLHSSPKIKPWVRYSECMESGDGVEGTVSEAGGSRSP